MSETDPAFPFRVREYVRWSDVDAAGIICYGAYVRFFEIAETELFRAAGMPYGKVFERLDLWLPRRALHFEFLAPAFLDDPLEVAIRVGRVGRTSLRLDFEVVRDDAARARTACGDVTLVAIDRKQLRPLPLPAEFIAALAPFTVPGASPIEVVRTGGEGER